MPHLVHQNMLRFGGGTAARNAAYQATFAAALGPGGPLSVGGPVLAAGFTEVTNNAASAVALGPICDALGVVHIGSAACGITALAAGPEYIGLGVLTSPAAGVPPVVGLGRFFLNADGGVITLIPDWLPFGPGYAAPANLADWLNTVPDDATPDYRGLVYAIIDAPIAGATARLAVGYLHNLYSNEAARTLVMAQIPNMLFRMGEDLPDGGRPALRALGGDFNVLPENRGTARTGVAIACSQGLGARPPGLPNPACPFTAGGTLSSGNLYDYWYVPEGQLPTGIGLIPASLDNPSSGCNPGGLMSDHCGATLQLG